jgi:hypothetical protein
VENAVRETTVDQNSFVAMLGSKEQIQNGYGVCLSEQHLVHVVKCYVAEYLQLFVNAKDNKLVTRQRWKPLQQEWLKVNVDGAFRENLCRGG